jgi:hypothetical protein
MLMRDEELIEQVRAGGRRLDKNPRDLWDKLIQEGVIDSEGNVLLRMPEPPPKKKPKKTPKSADGQAERG